METGASRQWPVWVWYAMVLAILGALLLADLAGCSHRWTRCARHD